MNIDAPEVRSYLNRAFAANYSDIFTVSRDLGWNSGYISYDDDLDRVFAPEAKDALNAIKGNIGEQFILTPIPNRRYKNAYELKIHLEWFVSHLKAKLQNIHSCSEKYKVRSQKQPHYSEVPPKPISRAIDLIEGYISSSNTALTMPELKDCMLDKEEK
jgi:hypothetical protein